MAKKVWNSTYCLMCEYFDWKKYGTCEAFPDGILHTIVSGEVSHFENIEGDSGIKFKEKGGAQC